MKKVIPRQPLCFSLLFCSLLILLVWTLKTESFPTSSTGLDVRGENVLLSILSPEKIAFRWLLNEVLFRHRCRVLECTGSMPLSSSKWGNKILVFSKILVKSSYQFSIFHVREPLKTNQIWSQYFSPLSVTSKRNKVQNMQRNMSQVKQCL